MLELLPLLVRRFLDLGTGDGRLLALAKLARPGVGAVGLDISPVMLQAARTRFAADPSVSVEEHNLSETLPNLGTFDVVLSSVAIHHVGDERKLAYYQEVFSVLEPGGLF